LADVGMADRNRAEMRERIERVPADPAEIAAFRAKHAEIDPAPAYVELSDDEVSARLHKIPVVTVAGKRRPPDDVKQRRHLTEATAIPVALSSEIF
jgi:hypothetical protein